MAEILRFQNPEELDFLRKRSIEALVELCKLAFDYLKFGSNVDKYQVFATNTGQTLERIQSVVETLLEFLLDAVRHKWSETDLLPLTSELGLSQDQVSVLWQFVSSKHDLILELLKQNQMSDLRFRQLDYRLEARIASRSLHSQAVPIITMKLHLDSETCVDKKDTLGSNELNGTRKELILETDPNCLVHLIGQLEQALQESKTHRTRNFVKAFRQ